MSDSIEVGGFARQRTIACVLAVVVGGFLIGCAPSNELEATQLSEEYQVFYADLIRSAQSDGVSEFQLEVLERASRTGDVSFDDLGRALGDTFQCFEDAGIPYQETRTGGDSPDIRYVFSPDTAGIDVADACITRHSMYVEWAYQTRPAVQANVDQVIDHNREFVIECLAEHGIYVPDDASVDELKQATLPTLEQVQSGAIDENASPSNCIHQLGLESY